MNDKKQGSDKNVVTPAVAAVTGVVVGVGVGAAGAVALADPKKRKKMKAAFMQVKDKAAEYMGDKNPGAKLKADIDEKISEGKKKMESTASDAKSEVKKKA